MPTYTFRNTETGEIFDRQMKIAELDQYKIDNPTHERYYEGQSPSIGDPVRLGLRKHDNGFKEVLQKIHERAPGSKLNNNIR
jgi:hypothetical protein